MFLNSKQTQDYAEYGSSLFLRLAGDKGDEKQKKCVFVLDAEIVDNKTVGSNCGGDTFIEEESIA